MQIVPYPHPALKFKSTEIQRIDGPLRKAIARMFELMYEANGIGLAANQVGLPLRFFIVNLSARAGQPDQELVFINPKVSRQRGRMVGEEGCLSLPGLYGDVGRAEVLRVEAFDLDGQMFQMDLEELEARVVQHEGDHLDGVMFPDRMREEGTSQDVDLKLPLFTSAWKQAQRAGAAPDDDQIREDLRKIARTGAVPEDFLTRPGFEVPVPEWEE
jgi:peptide deformylase